MHPQELWWLIEAKKPRVPEDPRKLSQARATEMLNKLDEWLADETR